MVFTFVRNDYEEHCLKGIAGEFGMELHVLKPSEIAELPTERKVELPTEHRVEEK